MKEFTDQQMELLKAFADGVHRLILENPEKAVLVVVDKHIGVTTLQNTNSATVLLGMLDMAKLSIVRLLESRTQTTAEVGPMSDLINKGGPVN